ncbi:MAG TPA: hypothetical protein VGF25_07985 [Thermoleophilaceae bacterium]|jgi:hypothetical protein
MFVPPDVRQRRFDKGFGSEQTLPNPDDPTQPLPNPLVCIGAN